MSNARYVARYVFGLANVNNFFARSIHSKACCHLHIGLAESYGCQVFCYLLLDSDCKAVLNVIVAILASHIVLPFFQFSVFQRVLNNCTFSTGLVFCILAVSSFEKCLLSYLVRPSGCDMKKKKQ